MREDQDTPNHYAIKQQDFSRYHQDAAAHHERAMKYHKVAAQYYESGNHEAAGHHAHIAHGHALQALQYTEEAARHHANMHDSVSTLKKS